MRTKDFIHLVSSVNDSTNLVIQVYSPGRIGGTPFVDIKDINIGFDWDDGRAFLVPENPLTVLSPDDVVAIRQSVSKGQSYHSYKEIQRLKEVIANLEKEVLALKIGYKE